MIADALDAFAQIFSPPFRKVMGKSLGLTAAMLIMAGVALDRLATSYVHVGPAWLSFVLSTIVALGLIVGMIFLAPPTASLVAGFYLDEIAAIVECAIDPRGAPGRPLPLAPSLALGLRFRAAVHRRQPCRSRPDAVHRRRPSVFLRPKRLSARPGVFRACGNASHVSGPGPRPVRPALAGGVWSRRDCRGAGRRARSQPVDSIVCDCAHNSRFQALRLRTAGPEWQAACRERRGRRPIATKVGLGICHTI